MSTELTPEQRLAISRSRLAESLREPMWLLLMQRWLHEKAQAQAHSKASSRTTH